MAIAAALNVTALWKEAKAKAEQECAENRAAVLRYPDLAKKLTEPPLSYPDAKQWNGYVPPEKYGDVVNRSDRRTALFDLVLEALTRRDVDSNPTTPEQA